MEEERRIAKSDSETPIHRGAMPIPISKFSIPHSGNSMQRSRKSIQGPLTAFLNSPLSIQECRQSIRKAQLPIPGQTAVAHASHLMGRPNALH